VATATVTFTDAAAIAHLNVADNRTLTLTGTNVGQNTLNAIIGDAGLGLTSLTKSGIGSWTLTAVSTYSGSTTVSGGTLRLTGTASHANSTLITVGTAPASTAVLNVNALTGGLNFSAAGYTLATGQTLAGHGTVNAATVGFSSPVNTTIAPGTSAGTLAITGNSVLAGNYAWESAVAGTGSPIPTPIANGGSSPALPHTNHDVLLITGTVDVTGLTFNISSLGALTATGFDPNNSYSWTALTSTGTLTGTPVLGTITGADFANAVSLGGVFSLATDTNNVYVNFAPIPEPIALGLIALGVTLAARRRRTA
jgi:autotransporter-associated beta strand protein